MPTNQKKKRRALRQVLIIAVVLLAVVASFYIFSQKLDRRGKVEAHFVLPDGSRTDPFFLEVADTDQERLKGLMYRKPGDMDPDEGMLFIFPETTVQSFWMKDTYISLDMIFMDPQLTVVGLIENVPVLTQERQQIGKRSKYVVELLAGEADRNGIVEGAVLRYEGSLPAVS